MKIGHTGHHNHEKMPNIFFDQIELRPDYFLNISRDTPLKQMADIMVSLEELVNNTFTPDLMIVLGDDNFTLAAALVGNKNGNILAQLESGLRSLDRTMQEEWNRILIDKIADSYFVTEKSGINYLKQENKNEKTSFVGNTMIDTMVGFDKKMQS